MCQPYKENYSHINIKLLATLLWTDRHQFLQRSDWKKIRCQKTFSKCNIIVPYDKYKKITKIPDMNQEDGIF